MKTINLVNRIKNTKSANFDKANNIVTIKASTMPKMGHSESRIIKVQGQNEYQLYGKNSFQDKVAERAYEIFGKENVVKVYSRMLTKWEAKIDYPTIVIIKD